MSDTDSKQMQKVSVWGRVAAWGVVFGLLAIVAVQLRTTQLGVVRTGEPAPEFNLVTFDSQEIGPEEMRGKILVVNFWASWCKPCEQEAADLQAAWEVYAPRGDVLFIGVDYVDTENEALKYIERFGITYPNGPDLGTRTAQAFRLQGVPETFFVDRQGQVAYVQIGPFTGLDSITSIVDRLLEN